MTTDDLEGLGFEFDRDECGICRRLYREEREAETQACMRALVPDYKDYRDIRDYPKDHPAWEELIRLQRKHEVPVFGWRYEGFGDCVCLRHFDEIRELFLRHIEEAS